MLWAFLVAVPRPLPWLSIGLLRYIYLLQLCLKYTSFWHWPGFYASMNRVLGTNSQSCTASGMSCVRIVRDRHSFTYAGWSRPDWEDAFCSTWQEIWLWLEAGAQFLHLSEENALNLMEVFDVHCLLLTDGDYQQYKISANLCIIGFLALSVAYVHGVWWFSNVAELRLNWLLTWSRDHSCDSREQCWCS